MKFFRWFRRRTHRSLVARFMERLNRERMRVDRPPVDDSDRNWSQRPMDKISPRDFR